MSDHTKSDEKAQRQVAAVEAVAERWEGVLAEVKQAGARWILDQGAMTLDTALRELRGALDLTTPPGRPAGGDAV